MVKRYVLIFGLVLNAVISHACSSPVTTFEGALSQEIDHCRARAQKVGQALLANKGVPFADVEHLSWSEQVALIVAVLDSNPDIAFTSSIHVRPIYLLLAGVVLAALSFGVSYAVTAHVLASCVDEGILEGTLHLEDDEACLVCLNSFKRVVVRCGNIHRGKECKGNFHEKCLQDTCDAARVPAYEEMEIDGVRERIPHPLRPPKCPACRGFLHQHGFRRYKAR